MMTYSSEILSRLVHNKGYIVFEKGAPAGTLKSDMISLRYANGSPMSLDPLPRPIFDSFLAASLIRQDGIEDEQHRIVFRLTPDGIARGEIRDRIMDETTGQPEGQIVGSDVFRISTGEKYATVRTEVVNVNGDYVRASRLYSLKGEPIGYLQGIWS
jgi:hypothetical protein